MSKPDELPDERVLVLMPAPRDAERTLALLAEAGMSGTACADVEELCREMAAGAGVVLLTEEVVTGERADRLAATLGAQPAWSDLPLIVLTREGAEGRHASFRESVNATLVERPVRMRTLLSVVRSGLRARRHQYEVRDHLAERRRAAESHAYLVKLADTLRPLSDPDEVQEAANRVLGEHLGANRVAYFKIDGSDYVVERDYAHGVASHAGRHPIVAFGTALLESFLAGRTVVEDDATAVPTRSPAERAAFAAIEVFGHVEVPLVKAGVFVAGMTVHFRVPRRWTAEEVALIEQTAERTWAAVEQAKAERALRAGEERFRSLFESMDEGYCVVEPIFDPSGRPVDYRYLLANPALEHHTGLRDVVGKTALEVMPGHEPHWIERYARVATTGEPIRRTDRVDDLGRWYEVSAFAVGHGQVGILFTDVTARHLAEEGLRASEARLAEIFRHAPSFMAVVSGPGHVFERVNDRYLALIGGRDVVGLPIREALPEIEGQGYFEMLDRVYQTGEPYSGSDHRVTVERGGRLEERVLDFVYQPIRDAGGAVTGVLVQGLDTTERRRAEAALRERDDRLQLLLGHATDYAVIISDPQDRILEWLGGAEKITGWRADEVVGQPVALIFTPEDRAAGLPDLETRNAAETGRAENTRWHQRKDGSRFFGEGVTVAMRGPAGELHGFGKVFRDATARKLAEQRLTRDAMLLANVHDAVVMTDLAGIVTYWNEGATRLFGWTAEERVGRHYADRFDEPLRSWVAAEMRERANGSDWSGEYEDYRKDGSRVWIDARVTSIRDSAGTVIGVLGVSHDISERKQAESALRERDERLHLAVAIARMGTFEIDPATDAVTVNETGQDIFGWSEPRTTFARVQSHFYPDDKEEVLRQIEAAFDPSGPGVFELEQRLIRTDGVVRWIRVRGRALFEGEGEARRAVLFVGAYLDVTDQKEAEEQLRDADRKKDDFLALLAHELRNPLAPIRNGLNVLRLARADDEAVKETREIMERQITHMVRLIDDLLDVSRINRNKMGLRLARMTLAEAVNGALETARPLIDAGGHTLTVSIPEEPIYLDADLTRLAQVFSNLLTNSAKYTRPGGTIRLTAERRGGEVVLSVSDNGIGIPAESLGNIFDMFSQVDRGVELATGGLGIGLALVKGLVEMHGGTVAAASAGEGQGSTFTVTLPVAAAPAAPACAPKSNGPPERGRRILVVDDNHDGASSLARMLRLLGNDVRTANDGLQGVEAAAEFRPEVVLMDVGMPLLNGLDATRRIRAHDWGRDMTIIALTGWGQEGDKQRSRDAGCNGHLVKPVDIDDLEKILGTAR
jgi:PAS domain S-box-containing protein